MSHSPSDLADLLERLDVELPPGEIVNAPGSPALWLSSDQPPPGLWARLRAAHVTSGLWPLLVNGIEAFNPAIISSSPDQHNADALLARMWELLLPAEDSEHFPGIMEDLRPFGATWPGASVRPPTVEDAGTAADSYADSLLNGWRHLYLCLVAADPADVIAITGWTGALNYRLGNSELCAVLRDWEYRFGTRVVALGGHASLDLSVAAPPQSESDALRVAAEHLAFCPDNVWNGLTDAPMEDYARGLIGARSWSFWWD
jgi:hypothetical protein